MKWLCGDNMKVNGLRVSNLEGLYNKQRKAGRQPLLKQLDVVSVIIFLLLRMKIYQFVYSKLKKGKL